MPRIRPADVQRVLPGLDVWDAWPLADPQGRPVAWRGGELWFALAAPAFPDPEQRHAHARIHHFHRTGSRFRHLGATFVEGFAPGSRQWSGSATLEAGLATLRFTAAGESGEGATGYRQRIFATTAPWMPGEGGPFGAWARPRELVVPRDVHYLSRHDGEGRIGAIKAFRDPAPYRSRDGREFLLFTASSATRDEAFNGVVGLAARDGSGRFVTWPPIVDASGINNELERPHVVEHAGLLYLFWSTQAKVFAPGLGAPTGLYGAVSERFEGPWALLNGHGLVAPTPSEAPGQSYSWWVLPDLTVASFVDAWCPGAGDARAQFGGTFAPFFRLWLEGARGGVAPA